MNNRNVLCIGLAFAVGIGMTLLFQDFTASTPSTDLDETPSTILEETSEDSSSSDSMTTTLSSDFTPPTGGTTGPGEKGLWENRLMLAWSDDGLTFTKTNVVITDQADVPDLVQTENGWIYLYYTGWTVGDRMNATSVAISEDLGETWTYHFLELSGFEKMASPVDPDIQLLSDGTFRLYLTSDPNDGDGPQTYYAESSDGIHFEKVDVAFAVTGKQVLDPSTLLIGDTWHYFAGGSTGGGNWHGTSTDGTSFEQEDNLDLFADGMPLLMSNGIAVEGGYRFYGFSNNSTSIYSMFTTDGITWTDEGVRLELDESSGYESLQVKDPTVVQLADGRYLMVYVTAIP
jgi:hypothetical protein